jgi:hypothetical protein
MRSILSFIAAILLSGCASAAMTWSSTPTRVQYLGADYRLLGQSELRSTVIASTIQSRDIIVSGDNAWRYDPSGRYWNFGHRGAPLVGWYWFEGNLVCHRLFNKDWCAVIYIGRNGQFIRKVVSPSDKYSDAYERITIVPGVTAFPWK